MAKILLDYFLENVEKYGSKTFMTQPMGKDQPVQTFTYTQTKEHAEKMAGHIGSLNLPAKSHIAICSKNCAYWVMADLAITMAGHVSIPIFPTLTAEITQYTLEHSESKLLFVGKMDDKPYQEMKQGFTDIPKISFPLCPGEDCADMTWQSIMDSATPALTTPVERDSEEMATIIYTSGSTGKPKGVMVSFAAMTAATEGIVNEIKVKQSDRYMSYLPCAHGMERWLGICVPLYSGEQLFFAESLDTFVADLNRCQPTLFLSVPRLWTKFQAGVFANVPEKKLNKMLKIPCIGSLVKKKLLKKLGLCKVRMAGSGSAPLSADVLEWYRMLGLELCEGYGMTENFNYSHMTVAGKGKAGYVGQCWPGVEHRIASDGEIQVKTPGKMMGYYKNESATSEALTEDGWVRTGDKGAIEEFKGVELLKITGRTKEIFKTSKGKYVAPAPLENVLVGNNMVELALVTGAGHTQPFALLQLSEFPKKQAMGGSATRDEYAKELEKYVKDVVNKNVEAHEKLQFVVVVSEEWLPENGFLTPTQKIKRAVIEDFYGKYYDEWEAKKQPVIWLGFEGKGGDAVAEGAVDEAGEHDA